MEGLSIEALHVDQMLTHSGQLLVPDIGGKDLSFLSRRANVIVCKREGPSSFDKSYENLTHGFRLVQLDFRLVTAPALGFGTDLRDYAAE